jgi:PST family polysaccharide transporter
MADPDLAHEADVTTVGHRAGRGLRWAMSGTLALKVGSFGLSLVMVRLLAPHEFGLYAVALAANAFVIHVNDMGMIAATVQWRGDVEEMLATARSLAIGFSVTWYAMFWMAAPALADLAGSGEATTLVRLLTFLVVIDGVTAVSVGMIQRRFEHDRLMKAIAVGFAAGSVVTVGLALAGAGALSFIAGALVQGVLVGVMVLRIAGLPFRLGLDRDVARRLLRFGVPLAAALGVESVLLFADAIVVGHVLGTALLGFYLLAFNISSWVPGLVGTAVRYVSIPAFSRLAEASQEDLDLGVRRALPLMVALVAPVAATLFVLSGPLIHVLYGARWVPAGEALRFLALVMVARMVASLVFDIQTGVGSTSMVVWVNLVWLSALVPALWWGVHLDGIRGAAAGHAIASLGVAVPLAGWLLQRCGVDMAPVLRGVVRPVLGGVLAAGVMAAVAVAVDEPLAELVLAGGVGMVAYLAVVVPRQGWSSLRRRLSSRAQQWEVRT